MAGATIAAAGAPASEGAGEDPREEEEEEEEEEGAGVEPGTAEESGDNAAAADGEGVVPVSLLLMLAAPVGAEVGAPVTPLLLFPAL